MKLIKKIVKCILGSKQVLSFEQEIEAGLNKNFHGNNKVRNINIGKYSYVSFNSIIYHARIGNYCSIGPNVVIGYGDHPINLLSTSPNVYLNKSIYNNAEIQKKLKPHFKEVVIEHDVWIGANVYIKNGVKISTGAIIGAGSVVIKDVNSYEIVAGVPAQLIRKRFDEKTINLLLKSNWWLFNPETLKSMKEIINNPTAEGIYELIKFLEHEQY